MYDGKRYDGCIDIDSNGKPWCYTDHSRKEWDYCEMETSDAKAKGIHFLMCQIFSLLLN